MINRMCAKDEWAGGRDMKTYLSWMTVIRMLTDTFTKLCACSNSLPGMRRRRSACVFAQHADRHNSI